MKKEEIKCPKCKSTFDISKYTDVIRREVLERFDEVIKEMKGGKK